MIDDEERNRVPGYLRVMVCRTCGVEPTERGKRTCETCLDKRRAARARNPDFKKKLVLQYYLTGTLYGRKPTRKEMGE